MTTLTHADYGTRYDWDMLRPWLQEQGVKVPEDVRSITVHGNGKVTLHQYALNEDGEKYAARTDQVTTLEEGEMAMRPPRRFKPTRPIPLLA